MRQPLETELLSQEEPHAGIDQSDGVVADTTGNIYAGHVRSLGLGCRPAHSVRACLNCSFEQSWLS